jgi:hypothetical protein
MILRLAAAAPKNTIYSRAFARQTDRGLLFNLVIAGNTSDHLYGCLLEFEQRLRVTNRHAEVGAPEVFDHRERNTDHFCVSVDQRTS